MIPRYESSEIASLWTEESRYQTFLEVELALLRSLEDEKESMIPKGTSDQIASQVKIHINRIHEIEKTVHHDVIAFCSSITEQLPPHIGRFFHFGVTSSDIIDTAVNLQVKRSLLPIIQELRGVLNQLKSKALETQEILTIGRSHGMYAEPMSFGQKFLSFYSEFDRRLKDLQSYYETECTAQFSGAVGNYTLLSTEIEKRAANFLSMPVEPLSTQVIPRDRLAKLVSINALLAGAIERCATELRHLHRSEVGEIEEGFKSGQKGSSTMPHKKNPIAAENLTGMARVIRSHILIALENMVLWHERDISHSSAERLYLPDHLGLLFYSLKRLNQTLSNLVIIRERIEDRVTEQYTYLSSYYLHFLLRHAKINREEGYEIVQKAIFSTDKDRTSQKIHTLIQEGLKERGITLTKPLPIPTYDEIKLIYTREIKTLYERVLGEEKDCK